MSERPRKPRKKNLLLVPFALLTLLASGPDAPRWVDRLLFGVAAHGEPTSRAGVLRIAQMFIFDDESWVVFVSEPGFIRVKMRRLHRAIQDDA